MPRIAIIEDSRVERRFAAACLRDSGFEVEEIEPSGVWQVFTALRKNVPDLLLLDYVMPDCPGEYVAQVCMKDPVFMNTRILVLTAHRGTDVAERCKALGVDEILYKPCTPKKLQDTIRRLLEKK